MSSFSKLELLWTLVAKERSLVVLTLYWTWTYGIKPFTSLNFGRLVWDGSVVKV